MASCYQMTSCLLVIIRVAVSCSRTLQQVKINLSCKLYTMIHVHLSVVFTKMEVSARHAVCTPEQTFVVGVCLRVCVWSLLYC